MNDLISIIIPVYNHKKALERALDSIFSQTYKNIEVIVIDDGSSEELRIKNYELRMVRQENRGAPSARNRGLDQAKGEYVIFWDADVIGEPDMLEKMYDALESNPEVSFVYSNFYFGYKSFKLQHFNITALQHDNYIHSTSLIRYKDAIKWDELLKRFQDWDYFLSLSEQDKKGVWIDEYLFKVLPGGTMSSWLPKFAYKKPWKYLPWVSGRVRKYEDDRAVIFLKHSL
ncbi:glycosyltransferase family 2 protein [Patescibacteria group bacterium]|nr:glycosyltransferase family 2 protein [Patescibacteria group bacterium]MBU1895504.1 glycosyltransferase family 2 protein [Patescibacteria group bacterium]